MNVELWLVFHLTGFKFSKFNRDSNQDDDGNEYVKKAIGLMNKTILCMQHTFWGISLPSLHNHDVEFSYATLYGEIKHTRTNFSFAF